MINLPAPKVVKFKRAFTLKIYDEVNLLVLEHPDRTQDDPGFDALYKWFSKQSDPWRWNTLFNMLPWPGITPFHVVEDFATQWYGLVGDKDLGRKVCSVDRNPVTADRYATESFQKIFPTRQFRLTEDLNAGLSWMVEGYDLSNYDQGHDVSFSE